MRADTTLKIEKSFNCLANKLHQKYNKINSSYHEKQIRSLYPYILG